MQYAYLQKNYKWTGTDYDMPQTYHRNMTYYNVQPIRSIEPISINWKVPQAPAGPEPFLKKSGSVSQRDHW
jgi:hypothetical protein